MDFDYDFINELSDTLRFGRSFFARYRVRPVSCLENKANMESGGRILMPASCIKTLSERGVEHPWLFRITNPDNKRQTHCGVLEFTAEEGRIYVPQQFITNLALKLGSLVDLQIANLPIGKFVKFQPQTIDFLDISNPRALLENCLRNYACLTVDDIISITYGEKTYALRIVSLGDNVGASRIIDCDIVVDFDPPVGYVEPTPENRQEKMLQESSDKVQTRIDQALEKNQSESLPLFKGKSSRLDGKRKSKDNTSTKNAATNTTIGIPDYEFEIGTLTYIRKPIKTEDQEEASNETTFVPFTGIGQQLKDKSHKH